MTKSLTIVIGSTRTNRVGESIANWVAERAKQSFENVELLDLKEVDLPKFDAALPPMAAPVDTPEARDWAQRIVATERLLFVTPEYNRSVPSTLKAAIDTLAEEWKDKPTAIVSYGFIEGGQNAGRHLRESLTHLQTDIVEETAAIQLGDTLIVDNQVQEGEVSDDTIAKLDATLTALAAK